MHGEVLKKIQKSIRQLADKIQKYKLKVKIQKQ